MFEETRQYVEKLGLPSGDLWDLPSSPSRFSDGAAYQTEVPTVNSVEAVAALLETADKPPLLINRITETYGIFRHTYQELKDKEEIGAYVVQVGTQQPLYGANN